MDENLFVPVETEKKQINFATVAEIYEDGISLIFDGEESPSEKHYRCNSFIVFTKGDRVRIAEDSGTYIVEYPIGNPRKQFEVDYAKKAGTADTATTAANANKLNNKAESNLSVQTAKYFTERHTGNRLGFFDRSGTTIDAIATLSTSATSTTIVNKINEILQTLKSYGLIN